MTHQVQSDPLDGQVRSVRGRSSVDELLPRLRETEESLLRRTPRTQEIQHPSEIVRLQWHDREQSQKKPPRLHNRDGPPSRTTHPPTMVRR